MARWLLKTGGRLPFPGDAEKVGGRGGDAVEEALLKRVGALRDGIDILSDELLDGPGKHFCQRKQEHGTEAKRQRSGEKGPQDRTQPPAGLGPGQLEEEVQAAPRNRMEERLGMTRRDDQKQSDDRQGDGAPPPGAD